MHSSAIFVLAAAAAGAFAAPREHSKRSDAISTIRRSTLPACVNGVETFDLKIRLLDHPDSADLYLVDMGGPAGTAGSPSGDYTLNNSYITKNDGTAYIATLKTTAEGLVPANDIVWVALSDATHNGWSPITCTDLEAGTLSCNAGANKVIQICGNFIGMNQSPNSNCQDTVAFDVQLTCEL
jgi:hypothetical protein